MGGPMSGEFILRFQTVIVALGRSSGKPLPGREGPRGFCPVFWSDDNPSAEK